MANPTSNFGWQMPTPVDLVTDLPADFEVFGQAVDSSLADLKGGTSGQILSKNSNTDMDFVWITNDIGDITEVTAGTGLSGGGTSGAVSLAIDTSVTADLTTTQSLSNKTLTSPKISTYTTNGDLVYGTGSSVITRLGIGSTNQVLTVSGGVPVWASAPSANGDFSLLSTTSLGGSSTTITGLGGYDKLMFVIYSLSMAATGPYNINITFNSDTGSNYTMVGGSVRAASNGAISFVDQTSIKFGETPTAASGVMHGALFVTGANSTGGKSVQMNSSGNATDMLGFNQGGFYAGSAVISSITITASGSTFDNGTVRIYGSVA